MRLLVDENLSPRVATRLRAAGFDATHVLERDLGGAPDTEVSALAVAEGRTIISSDGDFTRMLALSGGAAPSLVLLRSGDQLDPDQQAALLLANLPGLEPDLGFGAVVSISSTHVRVRRLPLR